MKSVELSVVIPVAGRHDDIGEIYRSYRGALESTEKPFEMTFVFDGPYPTEQKVLESLRQDDPNLHVVKLAKWFGEATALRVGLERSSGDILLTLPAYEQVQADAIPRLLDALGDADMVHARRWPRMDSFINRTQATIFNGLVSHLAGITIRDAGCGVRAMKRRVIEDVQIYGDLHRFLPVLAHQRGYKIAEIDLPQSTKDSGTRIYAPGVYVRRLLDLVTVFFLAKFTNKPLRFFGLVGGTIFGVGLLATLVVVAEKLLAGVPLGDRPALLLSSLLMVLGVQILAIGLVGELLIFTHARHIKEYTVDEIVE